MSEQEKAAGLTTTVQGVEVVSKEEIEKILQKVDKEATARKLLGTSRWIVYLIGVSWSIFQVYTAAFGLFPAQLQRSVHLAYAFVLTFLLYPAWSGRGLSHIWHAWRNSSPSKEGVRPSCAAERYSPSLSWIVSLW